MNATAYSFIAKCLATGAAALQIACSSSAPQNAVSRPAPAVEVKPVGTAQHGIASIYTDHRTASGERFSKHALTAAHKSIPLGSKVRVTNLRNDRSVIVRINDRGPYIKGRVIDLTPAAASKIGLNYSQGLTRVKVERL